MFGALTRTVWAWFGRTAATGDDDAPAAHTVDAADGALAQALCEDGVSLLQQGRAADALERFNRAAALDRGLARAHASRGLALRQLGRFEEAYAALQTALDIRPDDLEALVNQGEVSLQLARFEDAADWFNLALAIDERSVAAWVGLGMSAWEQGCLDEAIGNFRRVVEIDPSLAQGHLYLGGLLDKQERLEEALAAYGKAALLCPDTAEIELNCGLMLYKLKRLDESVARFERAAILKPDLAEAYFNLGNARCDQERIDEAIACHERAIAIRPDYAEAYHNLGNVLRDRGALDAAIAHFHSALAVKPDYAAAHENLGVALSYQDRPHEAIACYERSLAADPGSVSTHLNLAMARLVLADFARGWEGFEWRFRQTNPDNRVAVRGFPIEPWQGERLTGKSILVWGEQGIGDELRNASMYAEIANAAGRCVIECAPKLVSLFARSFPAATIVPRTDPPHAGTKAQLDFQCAAGSLARWLRTDLASFPQRARYLDAEPQRVEYWRGRLSALGRGHKVGISWRSTNLKGIRSAMCTRLDQWRPILSVPGVQFISLQYDECRAELARAEAQWGTRIHVFPEVDLFNDLAEAAALTQALDLVVTAPTAVSVLTAALGVPTWRMSYGPDWQLHGTERNLWHPSMTIFRRRWNQSWEQVIEEVGRALARLAADRAS